MIRNSDSFVAQLLSQLSDNCEAKQTAQFLLQSAHFAKQLLLQYLLNFKLTSNHPRDCFLAQTCRYSMPRAVCQFILRKGQMKNEFLILKFGFLHFKNKQGTNLVMQHAQLAHGDTRENRVLYLFSSFFLRILPAKGRANTRGFRPASFSSIISPSKLLYHQCDAWLPLVHMC